MLNYSGKLRVIERLWMLINTRMTITGWSSVARSDLNAWTFENAGINKSIVDEGDSWIPNSAWRSRSLSQGDQSGKLTVGITGVLRCAIFLTSFGRYTCLRLIHTPHRLERRLVFSSLVTALCHARSFLHILAAFGDRKASSLPSNNSNESFRLHEIC